MEARSSEGKGRINFRKHLTGRCNLFDFSRLSLAWLGDRKEQRAKVLDAHDLKGRLTVDESSAEQTNQLCSRW